MPAHAAGAGADPLILSDRLRVLASEIEIRTDVPELIERLGFLLQRAEQDFPVSDRCVLFVLRDGTAFRVGGGGFADSAEPSLEAAFDTLAQRIHRRAFAALPDHIRIHAASGTLDGRAFLVVAPKHAGKTTFIVHLLMSGFDVTGDELVLLRDGLVTPFPRKFYLREGTLALLPAVAAALPPRPPFVAGPEGRLVAVDPTTFGRPWRITTTPVAAILYLDPGHDGASEVISTSKVEMIERILPQCTPPHSGRPGWVSDLCAMIDRAATARLRFGELTYATDILRDMMPT